MKYVNIETMLAFFYIAIGVWALFDLSAVSSVPLAVSDMLIIGVAIGNTVILKSRE